MYKNLKLILTYICIQCTHYVQWMTGDLIQRRTGERGDKIFNTSIRFTIYNKRFTAMLLTFYMPTFPKWEHYILFFFYIKSENIEQYIFNRW